MNSSSCEIPLFQICKTSDTIFEAIICLRSTVDQELHCGGSAIVNFSGHGYAKLYTLYLLSFELRENPNTAQTIESCQQ